MSEKEKETAFLRRILLVHATDEGRQLDKKIARAQCEERCVLRVASVAALCGALAVAGLGYGAILGENIPYGTSETVIKILWHLVLASLICLMAIAAQLAIHRKKLNRLQEECRQLIIKIQAPYVGEPRVARLRAELETTSKTDRPSDASNSLRSQEERSPG